jgi:hypothetical protein
MPLYDNIKTEAQLSKEIREATEYRKWLEVEVSKRATRLNLVEEVYDNVKAEYQFRSNRAVQSIRTLRQNTDDLVTLMDEMKSIRHQLESDRAQMTRVREATSKMHFLQDQKFNTQVLSNVLGLSQKREPIKEIPID